MRVLGGPDHPMFLSKIYLPECLNIVCRTLDSVGKQTQSGFTLTESDSTRRE